MCVIFVTKLISSLRNGFRNRWREEAASTVFPKRRSVFFLTTLVAKPRSNQRDLIVWVQNYEFIPKKEELPTCIMNYSLIQFMRFIQETDLRFDCDLLMTVTAK